MQISVINRVRLLGGGQHTPTNYSGSTSREVFHWYLYDKMLYLTGVCFFALQDHPTVMTCLPITEHSSLPHLGNSASLSSTNSSKEEKKFNDSTVHNLCLSLFCFISLSLDQKEKLVSTLITSYSYMYMLTDYSSRIKTI